MSEIVVQHLTIEFPIYNIHSRSFKRMLFGSAGYVGGLISNRAGGRAVVTALNELNLVIKSGERVGLLGQNGAGKSTFLRALAGIYEPTRGRILAHGTIVPLFDISIGMDPDLNGYENIVIRGLMLGFTRSQIDTLVPEIERFTELGEYMRLPLRTYSTGMLMRLAFAISSFIEPDILLMDEWITTGDARFIARVEARMKEMVQRSRILVIATHAPELLRRMCTRVLILHHGQVFADGNTDDIIEEYAQLCARS